jgi:hypothetical protein
MLAYLKHLWATGDPTMRHEAFARIQSLVMELQATVGTGQAVITGWDQLQSSQLVARAYLKLGTWQWGLSEDVDDQVRGHRTPHTRRPALITAHTHSHTRRVGGLGASCARGRWLHYSAAALGMLRMSCQVIADVLASLRAATEYGRGWGKAWHHWALFNAAAMEHYAKTSPQQAIRHVAPAVSGFFRSIALEGSTKRRGGCLQVRAIEAHLTVQELLWSVFLTTITASCAR